MYGKSPLFFAEITTKLTNFFQKFENYWKNFICKNFAIFRTWLYNFLGHVIFWKSKLIFRIINNPEGYFFI